MAPEWPTRCCLPSLLLPGIILFSPTVQFPELALQWQGGNVLLFLDHVELVECLANNLLDKPCSTRVCCAA
jgi:hypothetical protein